MTIEQEKSTNIADEVRHAGDARFPMTFALYDSALASMPLFIPLPKRTGARAALLSRARPLSREVMGDTITVDGGPQSIPAQTLLLTLMALAALRRRTVTKADHQAQKLLASLGATGGWVNAPVALVDATYAEIAIGCGYKTANGQTRKLIVGALEQLHKVHLAVGPNAEPSTSHLLAFTSDDSVRVSIALNARLTNVVLAKKRQFTAIALDERRKLPSDTSKSLHVYLSGRIRAGDSWAFRVDRLVEAVYGTAPEGKLGKTRRAAINRAIKAIGKLARWGCTCYDDVVTVGRRARSVEGKASHQAELSTADAVTEFLPASSRLMKSAPSESPDISCQNETGGSRSMRSTTKDSHSSKATLSPQGVTADVAVESSVKHVEPDFHTPSPRGGGRTAEKLSRPARATAGHLNWFEAAGVARFDCQVGRPGGPVSHHGLTRQRLDGYLGWLGHENAKGADIRVRPARGHSWPVIFLDDVSRESADDFAAKYDCAVIETSPGLHHVWLRVDRALDERERMMAQRKLAHQPGDGGTLADIRSVSGEHFGRLAGFKNCKPERRGCWVNVSHTSINERPYLVKVSGEAVVVQGTLGARSGEARPRNAGHHANTDQSESGRDWANVMTALERGRPVAETRAELHGSAERRGKRDATGYADRTIKNAVLTVTSRASSGER